MCKNQPDIILLARLNDMIQVVQTLLINLELTTLFR